MCHSPSVISLVCHHSIVPLPLCVSVCCSLFSLSILLLPFYSRVHSLSLRFCFHISPSFSPSLSLSLSVSIPRSIYIPLSLSPHPRFSLPPPPSPPPLSLAHYTTFPPDPFVPSHTLSLLLISLPMKGKGARGMGRDGKEE